ncbi:MAG: nucleotidyltransferase domain-containing protein [bacterium]|nr:nucleotidyltransferase domain-containing protein [bacterium]
MALTLMASPCMADAESAAEAVAVEGVSRVLLFGSVARGQAGPDSDIDLVAIHDDLDYSKRRERSDELTRLARRAAGCRVFVYVTDWPEWTHRSNRVSTSLEYAITSDAVTLYDRAPNGARWGKEIGMPETNREEAAGRLHNALRALFGVQSQLRMSVAERDALQDRDPEYYLFALRDRLCLLCAHAQMAMETSLKALINLQGIRPSRTHDLVRLLSTLRAADRGHVGSLFVNVTPEEASMWRQAGAYEYADWSLDRLVPDAYHMARTSIAVSRYTASCLPDSDVARLVHKTALEAQQRLDRWDPTAEDPYESIGQPPPPDPAD